MSWQRDLRQIEIISRFNAWSIYEMIWKTLNMTFDVEIVYATTNFDAFQWNRRITNEVKSHELIHAFARSRYFYCFLFVLFYSHFHKIYFSKNTETLNIFILECFFKVFLIFQYVDNNNRFCCFHHLWHLFRLNSYSQNFYSNINFC